MKTRSLIIIGVIIFVVSLAYVSFAYNQEIKLATGITQSGQYPREIVTTHPFGYDYSKRTCWKEGVSTEPIETSPGYWTLNMNSSFTEDCVNP